ncbi:MAG: site-specific integrase [Robiginitomaculum sp.]|nr:site-specific integrase [Robiginitomaculum sp.]
MGTDLDIPAYEALGAFINHLRAERRLSPNTLAAYERDLNAFFAHIRDHGGERVDLGGGWVASAPRIFAAIWRRGAGAHCHYHRAHWPGPSLPFAVFTGF